MAALPTIMLCPAGTVQTASARLRCHVLARELQRLGCTVHLGFDPALLPDVLYVQKHASPELIAHARRVREHGGDVVFDIDDWGDALPWVQAQPQLLAGLLAHCSAVSVDTEVRAEVLAREAAYAAVPAFWVVPDPVDYVDATAPPAPARTAGTRLSGCWFGNGPNLAPALPYVQAALATDRIGRFDVITNAQFVPQMQQAWPMLGIEAWQLETFPQRLREHDFCLLIHDSNLEGIQKSNNKMLAALGQGVLPLVSSTPAYAETAQRLGLPELLLDTPADLAQRLQPQLLDSLRQRLQGDACRRLLDAHMPASVARGFLDRLLQLRSATSPQATAAASHQDDPTMPTSTLTPPPVAAAAAAAAPPPSAAQRDLEDLIDCWKQSPHPTAKISSYFPTYVKLFAHLRGRPCTFVETGVLDGGSLFMWRRWLGPQARIVGIDLNPAAVQWREAGFEIHIGDQGDPAFWRETLARIGRFDVLLDDGGHQSFQQIVTVQEALRDRHHPCLVVVEDTATSFMRDFSRHGQHSFLEYAKDATDCLVGRSFASLYAGRFPGDYNKAAVAAYGAVASVQFFNGIVAFDVDPEAAVTPQLLQNKPAGKASDFRYEGKDSAAVAWPNLLQAETVRVQGGPARSALPPVADGPVRLNLGCGDMPLPGYVNVDVAAERAGRQPDVCCDIRDLSAFPDGHADEVMAIHVIEHFYRWEVVDLIKEWVRVLKPGGKLVLETPNLLSACEELLKNPDLASRPDQAGSRTMWCFYGDPGWKDPLMCHRWLYTPQSLAQVMHEAGLRELAQTPPQFKARHPRDMRVEGVKPAQG